MRKYHRSKPKQTSWLWSWWGRLWAAAAAAAAIAAAAAAAAVAAGDDSEPGGWMQLPPTKAPASSCDAPKYPPHNELPVV